MNRKVHENLVPSLNTMRPQNYNKKNSVLVTTASQSALFPKINRIHSNFYLFFVVFLQVNVLLIQIVLMTQHVLRNTAPVLVISHVVRMRSAIFWDPTYHIADALQATKAIHFPIALKEKQLKKKLEDVVVFQKNVDHMRSVALMKTVLMPAIVSQVIRALYHSVAFNVKLSSIATRTKPALIQNVLIRVLAFVARMMTVMCSIINQTAARKIPSQNVRPMLIVLHTKLAMDINVLIHAYTLAITNVLIVKFTIESQFALADQDSLGGLVDSVLGMVLLICEFL